MCGKYTGGNIFGSFTSNKLTYFGVRPTVISEGVGGGFDLNLDFGPVVFIVTAWNRYKGTQHCPFIAANFINSSQKFN